MQIVIFIESLDMKTQIIHTTHSLHVTYEVKNPVKIIMPKTYHGKYNNYKQMYSK